MYYSLKKRLTVPYAGMNRLMTENICMSTHQVLQDFFAFASYLRHYTRQR